MQIAANLTGDHQGRNRLNFGREQATVIWSAVGRLSEMHRTGICGMRRSVFVPARPRATRILARPGFATTSQRSSGPVGMGPKGTDRSL